MFEKKLWHAKSFLEKLVSIVGPLWISNVKSDVSIHSGIYLDKKSDAQYGVEECILSAAVFLIQ